MSENKFIKKLKGEPTTGSLVEIKNSSTPTSFGNMPHGTSDPIVKYSDHRGNATVVAKGTQNWKLSGNSLLLASTVNGDGNDYTDEYQASGNGLWVNATYTFPTDPNNAVSAIFSAGTKWVLKLCGHNLFSSNETVDFTLLIKIGTTNIMSKTFTVRRKALQFCEEFVIDYAESLQSIIKAQGGDTLTIQVLCGDSSASATIYNGMTVLTVLQRQVDAETVASANHTFGDLEDEISNIHTELDGKVNIDGTSIMTAPLKFMSGSMRGAVGPYLNGVGFWKLDSDANLTLIATLSDSQFIPTTTNATDLGSSTKKWKDLYLSGNAYFDKDKVIRFNGTESNRYFDIYNTSDTLWIGSKYGSYEASLSFRAYTGAVTLYPNNDNQAIFGLPTRRWNRVYATNLCSDTNGVNLIGVPNKAGTMALMSDVELAANSGSQLYSTGVWYAKMYSATTVPTGAEYDGTNYADFSQVDGDNNPIIVIYEGQSGAWVQVDTITPPATYNGYITVTSKIWDIVEQTDQQGGQVLWSFSQKTFTPYPRIVSVDGLANTDLDNLTATGANIANWSNNVSNCITEIPQDIKLELNAGTLTLKAGSKVYVPNGAGVFDEVTRTTDLVYNFGTPTDGQYLIFNSQYFYSLSNCVSGATDSKAGQTYHSWYDTSNNLIKQYWADGSSPAQTDSLPVAIITITNGTITSIDQVFNGFGYIGSTVFALPNIKWLTPNGRNADGTLNNTAVTLSVVKTMTMANYMAGRNSCPLIMLSNESIGGMDVNNNTWGTVSKLSDIKRSAYSCWYCEEDNFVHYFNGSAVESLSPRAFVGTFNVDSNNKITSLKTKTVFHSLDYNDTEFIGHQAMPTKEKRYSFTVGVTGSSYVAPADGYVFCFKVGLGGDGFINIEASGLMAMQGFATAGGDIRVSMPIKKGDSFVISYNGNTPQGRFIYTVGSAE